MSLLLASLATASQPSMIGWKDSQLIDEDVRDPDAVCGDRQFGDIVEVLRSPLQKLINPELWEKQNPSKAAPPPSLVRVTCK